MMRLKPRRNKYGNKKTTRGGIEFDSKMEADYHEILLQMERSGLITDLRLQPKYLLQEAFEKNGTKHRAIEYVADFEYRDEHGRLIAVDVKGAETKEFILKRKMFDKRYLDIELKVLTKHNGRWLPIEEKKATDREAEKARKELAERVKKMEGTKWGENRFKRAIK